MVLIDLEDRIDCPGSFATSIARAFAHHTNVPVRVVVKHCCFENWLISDPRALMGARFKVTKAFESAVAPNKADNVTDATRLLNSIARGKDYHKRADAVAIANKLNPDAMARNSRSFRRLLRLLGHGQYLRQSRNPV
ncbi:MAG: DUF4276 family protein [Gammaproteobacteria bacterium]|nr:DUF4276 family protein [Gammaproteobacteria bacterium]